MKVRRQEGTEIERASEIVVSLEEVAQPSTR